MTRKHVLLLSMLLFTTLLAGLGYDYFHSLRVIEAKVVQISAEPTQATWREIKVAVLSDYPEYPLIPNRMRRFFRMQASLCFVNADGSELVNDDMQGPCLLERDEFDKKGKSHHMERSEFLIPLNLQASQANGKQLFLKQLRQQKGVWVRFGLWSYFFPPTVRTQAVFIDLKAFCQAQPEQCHGILAD